MSEDIHSRKAKPAVEAVVSPEAKYAFDVVVMTHVNTVKYGPDMPLEHDPYTVALMCVAEHELHVVRYDDPTERRYEFTIPNGSYGGATKTTVKVQNEQIS
jgi:hypothetical protein